MNGVPMNSERFGSDASSTIVPTLAGLQSRMKLSRPWPSGLDTSQNHLFDGNPRKFRIVPIVASQRIALCMRQRSGRGGELSATVARMSENRFSLQYVERTSSGFGWGLEHSQ